ncbi:MAG: symmetrical bis(5'-nucleosyl)-tetraphosphatase [Rhodospirillaceae bacterium]
MSTYAIGDVQGCYEPLCRLLERIAYDPARDELWFVGDLVNRGPESLRTLRFIRALGDRAVVVLGNHDLHLLAVAAGVKTPHREDALDDILQAPDREELLAWLRHRRMMHAARGYAMVHAGLLPQWDIPRAMALAAEVEAVLQGSAHQQLFEHMYGNTPAVWRDDLHGYARLRVIINAMTRLRLCTQEGEMEFGHKAGPETGPAGYMPWFDVPGRASAGTPILCGHWAALGLMLRADVLAIDTGCVWGRALSALRLEDRQLFQCDCG